MRRIVRAMVALSPSERDREEPEREPIYHRTRASASFDDIYGESEQNKKSDLFSDNDLDSDDDFKVDSDDDISLDGLEIMDGSSVAEPPVKEAEFLADKPPPYTFTTTSAPTPRGPSRSPTQEPVDEELLVPEFSHASPFDGPPLLRTMNEKRSPPPSFAASSSSQPALPPPFFLPPQFSRRAAVAPVSNNPFTFRAPKSRRLCIVCNQRPAYEKKGKKYPTCGLTCADTLKNASSMFMPIPPNLPGGSNGSGRARSRSLPPDARPMPLNNGMNCVICMAQPCRGELVTCSAACAERLCTGGGDPRMCDFCRRRPKAEGYNQCGATCAVYAKTACLLCKCRPKHPRYHLCGSTCKQIATKWTPMLLEAHPEHETFKLVERKFNKAWQGSVTEPLPNIKHIYKIFESKAFLKPYDQYKRRVGNEAFRYHGTKRRCKLGTNGNTDLCNATRCHLCQILKTSFKVALANPRGSFGPGVYSSTASNAAYFYTAGGTGAVIVSKVILGKTRDVNAFGEVTACPTGFNSVVFNRNNGARNETVVYTDDAIRPVFLIIF